MADKKKIETLVYVNQAKRLMEEDGVDWSSYQEFQEADSGTLTAAIVALHQFGVEKPNGHHIRNVLANFYGYHSDESAMASGEKDTQAFMDKADELRLGAFALDMLNKAVSDAVVRRYEKQGWTVVDLERELPDVAPAQSGFYIFTTKGL